jgi:deoxyribodipyrimidine photo-lyase
MSRFVISRITNKPLRVLRKGRDEKGPIVYWMSRDQRVRDNWAIILAQEMALERKSPLVVIFCLVPEFLEATVRQYSFMLKGLQEVKAQLQERNIPFYMLAGQPEQEIPLFIERYGAGSLVTDFDPLRIKRKWKEEVAQRIDISIYEVDAHNIVPCWIASPKQEYAAYTIRPRINRLLPEFLDDFPESKQQKINWDEMPGNNWDEIAASLELDLSVPEVDWIIPGEEAAQNALESFLMEKLDNYPEDRNDPNRDGQSNLSPYLHFGHISSQRIALEVNRSAASQEAKSAFLEELIVRRELSDNFCFYNSIYDSFDAFPDWAKRTLDDHRRDEREYLYSPEQLELSGTHDELWNAAQNQMVVNGKMHGYMRMYWAKKILEWSESPEEAMRIAIYLNDRYELDGRDPNGYTGIAWSIGGIHDRAWKERPVFGKIRYMSYNGCKSKFNVDAYVSMFGKSRSLTN